jgi:two-component system, chemotaxis family, sensor kinase CheA
MVDGLLEDMKKVVMLPVSSFLQLFPKLVRDLARDQGKEAELVIRGGEIEIDKRILEEMKDPFIHLLRNCVDHGIEKPEERARKRKLPRGTIAITFEPKNSRQVEILISDDGVGIDVAKVRSTALKDDRLAQEEGGSRSQQEALSLIFESGVSTSPIITDLSGRGLGLAIVREKVEKLGGAISVETQPDSGTTFRIMLPLALTTFRGVIVRVGERQFVLPTISVERVTSVNKAQIKTVENRETIQLSGQILSLVKLADTLELPPASAANDSTKVIKVVVLTSAEKRLAFLVDEVLGEQEVLVKSLGQQLSRVRNVAGATILGTGSVVPILNISDLIKSAVRSSIPATRELTATTAEHAEARRKSILVAEDSITARTLLKNILETAGYVVATAVDGVDAFTQLRSGEFDLVVSDVEMPRMSGFDLTVKIRGDKKLADLPLVLVTALEARGDRERGIEVGANAYIVKSSFDQSNLLAVIQKLI